MYRKSLYGKILKLFPLIAPPNQPIIFFFPFPLRRIPTSVWFLSYLTSNLELSINFISTVEYIGLSFESHDEKGTWFDLLVVTACFCSFSAFLSAISGFPLGVSIGEGPCGRHPNLIILWAFLSPQVSEVFVDGWCTIWLTSPFSHLLPLAVCPTDS